ncbi:MAG: D-alanyl-lipoteichoic acid biosynthesis protein DltD [Bacilli bacterium]
MKKLIAIGIVFVLMIVTIFGYNSYLDKFVVENESDFNRYLSYDKFWSNDILSKNQKDKIYLFGSSELSSMTTDNYYPSNFFANSNINLELVGGGYFQSLNHAITLGSISNVSTPKEVILFLSPQWFQQGGVGKDAYPGRFSEDHLINFLQNNNISKENKEYVLNRNLDLLSNSETLTKRVNTYKRAYETGNIFDVLYTNVYGKFNRLKQKYSSIQLFKKEKVKETIENIKIDETVYNNFDFQKSLKIMGNIGEKECTNNEFGVGNDYWNTYVNEIFKQGEVKVKQEVNTESPEFEDLKLFLNVAKELGIKAHIFLIPVNAYWYDYIGEKFNNYYVKIKEITNNYGNVNLIDFSSYQYEKYFFKDIMHLGWKGWVRVDEAILNELGEK